MKRTIITLFIAVAALTVKAQQQPAEKPAMVLIPVETLKKTLSDAYAVIANSNAPYKDAAPVLNSIQQLYPQLVALKQDTAKAVIPKKK